MSGNLSLVILFQTDETIELRLLSTHDVNLYSVNSVTVMPSGGEVVVHGDNHKEQVALRTLPKYAIQVYKFKGGLWTHRIITVTCKHEGIELLGLSFNGQDRLAVSCPKCQNIKLVNLETDETTMAYSSTEYRPDYMCHGVGGELYVNSLGQSYPVMKLDCSGLTFTGPCKTLDSGLDRWCSGMCCIPEPYRCLVLSVASEGLIRAICSQSGKLKWLIDGTIDGTTCHPWGLLYLNQHQRLLVCDGANNRVLVLHPRDGAHLQTVQFPKEIDGIYDLFFSNRDNEIGMHHKTNVSFLTLTVGKNSIGKPISSQQALH